MKALLVGEYREGKLLESTYELVGFAQKLGCEFELFLVGTEAALPQVNAKLYLADVATVGEYNPALHKQLILDAVDKANADTVVFLHSSSGWDLAPRVALALGAAQLSEVVEIKGDGYLLPACNAKLRRTVKAATGKSVITLQAGAFMPAEQSGAPQVEKLTTSTPAQSEFLGYEQAEAGQVDLGKAEIIVSAGRGVGKPENVAMIQALAEALGGEYGASRPVVDAGWAPHDRQVGTTGQVVSPKLYVACGISGAIQHLAGMKKSEFILAINTDKDAPIGEVADVLVVADIKQFAPALTAKLAG
ncbi:electron transfer flavoprotein subunit alpha/FixB family protein [Geopsychrobacter electrodiphilus]|uniref:electron transfer flavoprotein subunit alpha/FixB family protein n=1 Tax=Geopsychrobacter electrodiphilus TaxID=225196 RepID=UPI00035F93E8|nr:electron transfer flavoprotein subunit alpha/FixB family protein [Geopsychrobacter electrodiphilus]